jgi:hypothetical protein
MEAASVAAPAAPTGDRGLKSGALGYISNLVIGVASTPPGAGRA